MNTAVVIFLVCSLVVLALVLVGSEWLREGRAQFDLMRRAGLADVDIHRWDREMPSQSALFDDDGWLR